MEEMKCENCGAPLEADGHCSYCGARYRRVFPGPLTVVELEYPQVHRLSASTRIPKELAIRESIDLGKYAQAQIVRSMAEQLSECIKYTTHDDPYNNCVIVRGDLRVVPPDFRF